MYCAFFLSRAHTTTNTEQAEQQQYEIEAERAYERSLEDTGWEAAMLDEEMERRGFWF